MKLKKAKETEKNVSWNENLKLMVIKIILKQLSFEIK